MRAREDTSMIPIEPVDRCAAPWPEARPTLHSRLRQRIDVLERLIQSDQSAIATEPLLEPMRQRLRLLERMVDRLGVDGWRGQMVGLAAREAEATCLSCTRSVDCRRWLDGAAAEDAHLGFCPNAALLGALRQASSGGASAGDAKSTRIMGRLATWWRCRASPPDGCDDGFCPHADEVKRIQRRARQQEVRALLDAAICP